MSVPTFTLLGCPRCSSHEGGLTAPLWKFAHNTSAKRKRNCYFWVEGCGHARGFSDPKAIYDEPAEWARIEAAWKAKAEAMFTEQTATWSAAQRERWRAMLESSHYVTGTTKELELKP